MKGRGQETAPGWPCNCESAREHCLPAPGPATDAGKQCKTVCGHSYLPLKGNHKKEEGQKRLGEDRQTPTASTVASDRRQVQSHLSQSSTSSCVLCLQALGRGI